MIFGITENAERDQTIQHRRINRGQPVTPLSDSFEHPTLGFLERAFARRTNAQRMQNMKDIVDAEEEISPRPKLFAARQPQVALLGTDRIKLVQLLIARQRPGWFEMVDDRERNQHRATPRRHFVDVERRPGREQNHLDRNRWQIFPRKLAEEREIKFAERVHPRNAAETQNALARFSHE